MELFEVPGGVAEVQPSALQLADGRAVPFDECLWTTQASAAGWLAATGLPVADDGFLLVDDFLQSDGGPPNVFAAGDVASNARAPRPKAGVFAVRAVRGRGGRGGCAAAAWPDQHLMPGHACQ